MSNKSAAEDVLVHVDGRMNGEICLIPRLLPKKPSLKSFLITPGKNDAKIEKLLIKSKGYSRTSSTIGSNYVGKPNSLF